jgi:hypothetical protein
VLQQDHTPFCKKLAICRRVEAILRPQASLFFREVDKKMVQSLLLYPDGKNEVVDWPHEKVALKMGGPITFVGAINELHVFVVALADSTGCETNMHCKCPNIFMELPVNGPVLFVATDDDGEPMCVNAEEVKKKFLLIGN